MNKERSFPLQLVPKTKFKNNSRHEIYVEIKSKTYKFYNILSLVNLLNKYMWKNWDNEWNILKFTFVVSSNLKTKPINVIFYCIKMIVFFLLKWNISMKFDDKF